ncbi:gliding motility-associated C-terminal domain-containing protein, partial [Acinetobacter baumannii]
RGGQEIFRSIGYASPWNGTFNNIPVPIGTYYYLIKISDINKTLSGSITLLR